MVPRRLRCANAPETFRLRPTTMTAFCKNEDCPSSNELLAYENGDLSRTRTHEITGHLTVCEFCEAEAELYSRYPQFELIPEVTTPVEIPAPLFELAEALLKHHHADARSLNSLLNKKKDLVVDKA